LAEKETIMSVLGTFRIALLAAGLCWSGAIDTALAQDDAPQPTRVTPVIQPRSDDRSWLRGPIVSFSFPGGTVQQYVEALRKVADKPVNVAVDAKAAKVLLPPISMQSVYLHDALQVIEYVSERSPNLQVSMTNLSQHQGRGPVGPAFPNGSQGTTAAFAIVALERSASREEKPDAGSGLMVNAMSIADLVDERRGGMSAATVLSAIEAALQLAPAGNAAQPELKFHRDSNLLILRGDAKSTSLLHNVLEQIRMDVRRQRGEHERVQGELLERQAAVRRAEIDVRTARAQMQLAQQRFDALRQMEKTGAVSADEILKMQSAVNGATADVERAEVAFELARGKLEMLVNPQPPTPPAAPPAVGGPSGRTPPPPGR
jgi:hypothetical protein